MASIEGDVEAVAALGIVGLVIYAGLKLSNWNPFKKLQLPDIKLVPTAKDNMQWLAAQGNTQAKSWLNIYARPAKLEYQKQQKYDSLANIYQQANAPSDQTALLTPDQLSNIDPNVSPTIVTPSDVASMGFTPAITAQIQNTGQISNATLKDINNYPAPVGMGSNTVGYGQAPQVFPNTVVNTYGMIS